MIKVLQFPAREVEIMSGPSEGASAWHIFAAEAETRIADRFSGPVEVRRFARAGHLFCIFVINGLMDRPIGALWITYSIYNPVHLAVEYDGVRADLLRVTPHISMRVHAQDRYNIERAGVDLDALARLAEIGRQAESLIGARLLLVDPANYIKVSDLDGCQKRTALDG